MEALSILAGLDPARSSIEWTRSNSSEATIASPIVQDACFFADWRTTFFPPHSYAPGQSKSKLLTAIEDSRAIGFEDAAQELIRKVNQEQESAFAELELLKRRQVKLRSEMLKCISQRWYSSIHDTKSRQTPKFFIQWAEALGFHIEWASWARKENLLGKIPAPYDSYSTSGGTWSNGDSENNRQPEKSAPAPLTTTEIAEYFCDFRWKTPKEGRKKLGKKPAWLRDCIAIPGHQGKSEIRWHPVDVGAQLVINRYATAPQIRSRFMKIHRLKEWLEIWRDYEADYLSTS